MDECGRVWTGVDGAAEEPGLEIDFSCGRREWGGGAGRSSLAGRCGGPPRYRGCIRAPVALAGGGEGSGGGAPISSFRVTA